MCDRSPDRPPACQTTHSTRLTHAAWRSLVTPGDTCYVRKTSSRNNSLLTRSSAGSVASPATDEPGEQYQRPFELRLALSRLECPGSLTPHPDRVLTLGRWTMPIAFDESHRCRAPNILRDSQRAPDLSSDTAAQPSAPLRSPHGFVSARCWRSVRAEELVSSPRPWYRNASIKNPLEQASESSTPRWPVHLLSQLCRKQ